MRKTPHNLILLALLPLLALSERVLAVGITTIGAPNNTLTSFVSIPGAGFGQQDQLLSSGLDNFNRTSLANAGSLTSAPPYASASSDWFLTNSATSAVFGSTNNSLSLWFDEAGLGIARNTAFLGLTLSETLDYSVEGSGTFQQESGFISGGHTLIASIVNITGGGFVPVYQEQIFTNSSPVDLGLNTGSLGPGDYLFFWNNELQIDGSGGTAVNGIANWTVTLSQHDNGNRVPDAGSTVTLLGMAFSALGMVRRFVA